MSLHAVAHRPVAAGFGPSPGLDTWPAVEARPRASDRSESTEAHALHHPAGSETWPTYLDFDAGQHSATGAGMAQYVPVAWSTTNPAQAANAPVGQALHQLAQAYRYAILLC